MRYLLPCSCGDSVAISPSQAGGVVECPSCGDRLEAPRLRELRELPRDEQASDSRGSSWGFSQGVLSTGLILAAILAAGGLWFHRQAPEPPKPFDPAERLALVEKSLEQATPAALWDMFVTIYEPAAKRGLQKAETTADRNTLAAIEFCQTYRNRLWIAAGAVAVGTLALFPLLPRSANPSS